MQILYLKQKKDNSTLLSEIAEDFDVLEIDSLIEIKSAALKDPENSVILADQNIDRDSLTDLITENDLKTKNIPILMSMGESTNAPLGNDNVYLLPDSGKKTALASLMHSIEKTKSKEKEIVELEQEIELTTGILEEISGEFKDYSDELDIVLECAKILHDNSMNFQQRLESVLDILAKRFNIGINYFFLINKSEQLEVYRNWNDDEVPYSRKIPRTFSIFESVIKHDYCIFINDHTLDERTTDLINFGFKNKPLFIIPMKTVSNDMIGIYVVNDIFSEIDLHREKGTKIQRFIKSLVPFLENEFLHQTVLIEQKRTQNVIASMMDMLIVLNPNLSIDSVNKRSSDILDYGEKELIGKEISEILYVENESGEMEKFESTKLSTLINNNELNEISAYCKTQNHQFIPVSITGSAMHGEIGTTGSVLSIKDARDSRLLKELKDTQAQLIQSGKLASLGEMSSGIAHELNNPLFLIKGYNERIVEFFQNKGTVKYDEVRDYLNEVDENCSRMSKIIKHFREFSRQAEQRFDPVNINEIVYKSFILLLEQLRLRNITVSKNFSKEKLEVMGDPNSLEQVCVNLISNARDAIEAAHPESGGEISCKVFKERSHVKIEFEDNGSGISPKSLDRVFDPFFTTKEVGKGTGLGLSISHGIIKDHKGEIFCQSEEGKGTKFTILLPLQENS